ALLALLIFRSLADGVGGACYYPAANSLIGQFHHKTRATAMAIHQTALYCGIIASSLAALIGQEYGWRNAFYLFGVVGIVMALVVLLRVRDTPMPRARTGREGSPERAPSIPEVLRHVLSKRTVLLLAIAFAGHVFVENGYRYWVPSFLEEAFGLSTFQASFWSMAAHYAGAFLGVTLGGRFSDRFAVRRRAVRVEFQYLGMMLASPFIIWMGLATGPVTCCIALALFGFFRGIYDSNLFAAPFEVIEPRYRASAVGLMLACAFVMGASAPALLGWMADVMSMSTAMASMAAVYFLSGVVVLIARYTTFADDAIDESPEEPKT
ncbi:MAG: MFS transporter, partial [Patescibacteria group bacterium]|nr:MFS transporter [Patescibacteria group bacterium]